MTSRVGQPSWVLAEKPAVGGTTMVTFWVTDDGPQSLVAVSVTS